MFCITNNCDECVIISGYEQIYESLIPRLSTCDFSEGAVRLGMSLHPNGTLSVGFLGREYEISARGVNAMDGKPVHVNNRSVLAYFALSRGIKHANTVLLNYNCAGRLRWLKNGVTY